MTNPKSRKIKFRIWTGERLISSNTKHNFFISPAGKLYYYQQGIDKYEGRFQTQPGCKLLLFTGLHDKNGKEIYEGDILNKQYHNMNLYDGIGIIEMGFGSDADGYDHGSWYGWKCGESSLDDVYKQAEIIGNIYENPELLENK